MHPETWAQGMLRTAHVGKNSVPPNEPTNPQKIHLDQSSSSLVTLHEDVIDSGWIQKEDRYLVKLVPPQFDPISNSQWSFAAPNCCPQKSVPSQKAGSIFPVHFFFQRGHRHGHNAMHSRK